MTPPQAVFPSGLPRETELRRLWRRDPVLGAAMKTVPPFPGFPLGITRQGSHFHSLARSIVYQQLATRAAATIYGRVRNLTPGRSFPSPPQILEIPDEVLRGAGLSRGKSRAIRDLAERITEGRLKLGGVARHADDEIVRRLTEVWGIGEWTAQMFLMFRLGRLDVMPTGDLGVQEGLRRLDGLVDRPAPLELSERAQVWAPLRSVAAWVLWRLVDP